MQLLLGGEADVIMSYDITILNAAEKGAPVKAFFTSFQFDLIGLMTRPDVGSLAELKGRKVFFGANGYSSYWPWLKRRFGYTDDMAAPKGPSLETFFNDPTSAVAGYHGGTYFRAAQRASQVLPVRRARLSPMPTRWRRRRIPEGRDNSDAVARFLRVGRVEGLSARPSAGNALIR